MANPHRPAWSTAARAKVIRQLLDFLPIQVRAKVSMFVDINTDCRHHHLRSATPQSLISVIIEAEEVEHITGNRFSFLPAAGPFFLGAGFLTELSFLGNKVGPGGLI